MATIRGSTLLPAGCSPQKVPQFMINEVLAICPHVNPKDVAKDLVITGSTTRTINRILDGQFPAAINIEDTPSDVLAISGDELEEDKVSLHRNSVPLTFKNQSQGSDSPETEMDTDSDDEDESRSLFTALKNRLHSRDSNNTSTKLSKIQIDSSGTSCKPIASLSTKNSRSGKVRDTSSIIDISFSDNSDDDDLCLQEKYNSAVSKKSLSSSNQTKGLDTCDCIIVPESNQMRTCGSQRMNEKTQNVDLSQRKEAHFMDSPQSDKETDYNKDIDDFPCMLPISNVPSESQSSGISQSCLSKNVSASCSDCLDDNCAEIPAKRKKRTPEEILSQKNEVLRRKQARKCELQAKKEAREKEKQERQLAREQMKIKRDKEKLLKKAETMNQKSERLDGCIKQIVVCIDPDILHGDQLSAENTLLQKLELLGAGHEIVTQLIPSSVTWKRLNVEHTVDDTLQVVTKTSYVMERHTIVRLPAIKFVEMVSRFSQEMQNSCISSIDDNESLANYCERVMQIYAEKVVTLVIMGLEQYFKNVKLTNQRQFRNAVLGPSSSDTEKPSGKGRKKTKKGPEVSVVVSRVDVEEALVDLQLRQPNCRVRMFETEEEFAEMLSMFTKAVAEAPYKKKQPEILSFCVEGGEKGSVKVSKEGSGLKRVWLQHFQQFRNVSSDMASAIVTAYPSPQSLLQAYYRCNSKEAAARLLQDIVVRRGAGVLATTRRIGPELSRRVHMLFTCDNGDLPLK